MHVSMCVTAISHIKSNSSVAYSWVLCRFLLFYLIEQNELNREITSSRLSVVCGPHVALTACSIKAKHNQITDGRI